MTGNEIYKQACMLLECEAEQTENARDTALCCLNVILCDFGFCKAPQSLEEKIEISPTNGFIAAFGVAMLLAQIRLDTVRGNHLAQVYNLKRQQAKNEIARRGDAFPIITA